MPTSDLCLHKGARLVTLDELARVKAPPPEGRWYPVSHAQVHAGVTRTLEEAGYRIERQQLALSREGHRFFGTLDLATTLATGVKLCCGIRNSIDKSFPLGFCAGNRVDECPV
jgi:hypothetical protein